MQNATMDGIAPDGSPVEMYLSLPAAPDLDVVRSVVGTAASILDLGCGVGRLANPLAEDGHQVAAVDESHEMLACLHGPEPVHADVWQLDLGRRFDVVLAMSHLINDRSTLRGLQLLRVCRRHVHHNGIVLIQRYPPQWLPAPSTATIGPVEVDLHDVVILDDGFSAAVTYSIGPRSWVQHFDGRTINDGELQAMAAATGFNVREALDDANEWIVLEPTVLGNGQEAGSFWHLGRRLIVHLWDNASGERCRNTAVRTPVSTQTAGERGVTRSNSTVSPELHSIREPG